MDLIAQALAKRENLKAELTKIEQFLAVAYELQGGSPAQSSSAALSVEQKIDAPLKAKISRARSGIGEETAKIAKAILTEAGRPLSTRDLLPLVEAHNIEIGGKDKVATLSARLSNFVKKGGQIQLVGGKWYLSQSVSDADNEETADTPSKEEPAASFFSNQEGGEPIGTALN